MRNPVATIAMSAKDKEVLGWWEILTEKMMIEGAIPECNAKKEMSVWKTDIQKLRL